MKKNLINPELINYGFKLDMHILCNIYDYANYDDSLIIKGSWYYKYIKYPDYMLKINHKKYYINYVNFDNIEDKCVINVHGNLASIYDTYETSKSLNLNNVYNTVLNTMPQILTINHDEISNLDLLYKARF